MFTDNLMLLTKESGFFAPFSYLLGWILNGIFTVLDKINIPNSGLAIVFFTIVVYTLMLPLTYKQQKFSKLQSKMNPEIQAIQAKYKGRSDQESMMAMNQETQNVYAKYGVSPFGSCLQLLIQMPILFSLYRVIYNIPAYVGKVGKVFSVLSSKIVETDGAQFLKNSGSDTINTVIKTYGKHTVDTSGDTLINGVTDVLNHLSTADMQLVSEHYGLHDLMYEGEAILTSYDAAGNVVNTGLLDKFNNFLGLNISNAPQYTIMNEWASDDRNWGLIIGVLMIPILSALTQWINTKLMPQPENAGKNDQDNPMVASMKTMNNIMPLMSAFFCFSLPVGMGIYWISGSIVRSIIQICINKHIDKMDIDEMIKKNVEAANKKRAKQGLPPQQITNNATKNTKLIEPTERKIDKNKLNEQAKEATNYYNTMNQNAKPGSLASKALMVKNYNEKNTSDKK